VAVAEYLYSLRMMWQPVAPTPEYFYNTAMAVCCSVLQRVYGDTIYITNSLIFLQYSLLVLSL